MVDSQFSPACLVLVDYLYRAGRLVPRLAVYLHGKLFEGSDCDLRTLSQSFSGRPDAAKHLSIESFKKHEITEVGSGFEYLAANYKLWLIGPWRVLDLHQSQGLTHGNR